MKNPLLTISLAAFLSFASHVQAAEEGRDFGEIYTDCGLGALIAENVKEESTGDVMAIVTNVTFDLGTTAILSNISSPSTCARGDAKTAAFILKSYSQLEKDLVLGNGRYLDALIEISGIGKEETPGFLRIIRAEFAREAALQDYEDLSRYEKAELLYDIVESHS